MFPMQEFWSLETLLQILKCTVPNCAVALKYENSIVGHNAFQKFKNRDSGSELEKVDNVSKKGKNEKPKKNKSLNAITQSTVADLAKEIKKELMEEVSGDDENSDKGRRINHPKIVPCIVNSISGRVKKVLLGNKGGEGSHQSIKHIKNNEQGVVKMGHPPFPKKMVSHF